MPDGRRSENIQALDRAYHSFDVEDVQVPPLDALLRRATKGSLPHEGDHLVTAPPGTRLPMFPLTPMIPILMCYLVEYLSLTLLLQAGLRSF